MIAEAFSPSQNYGSHFILRRSSKDVIDQTSKDILLKITKVKFLRNMLIVAVLNWSLSSWKSFVNHLSFGAAPPDAGVTTQRAVEVWIYGLTWRRNNLGNNSLGGTPGVLLGIIRVNFMKQPWKQFTQRGILYTWDLERTGGQSGKKHDFVHLRSILFSDRIWKKADVTIYCPLSPIFRL